jgi:hypothetical protein
VTEAIVCGVGVFLAIIAPAVWVVCRIQRGKMWKPPLW